MKLENEDEQKQSWSHCMHEPIPALPKILKSLENKNIISPRFPRRKVVNFPLYVSLQLFSPEYPEFLFVCHDRNWKENIYFYNYTGKIKQQIV